MEKYFAKNNLGEVPYKVAAVGTKGKEKYMATVTVEGTQFKTYPQTYNTRVSGTCGKLNRKVENGIYVSALSSKIAFFRVSI